MHSRAAIPVLPVITKGGAREDVDSRGSPSPSPVHGVAIQVAACAVPTAHARAWREAGGDAQQQSLSLLFGCLFGVTTDAMFAVSKKENSFPAADVCVACLDSPPDVRLLPCGHMCTCSGCWQTAMLAGLQRRCFFCRQPVTQTR